jgi:nitrile hydratase accessory protein
MSQAVLRALARELGCEEDQVFSAPWEARAFAIALGLSEAGLFSWDDFRSHLIAEVGASDRIRERDGTADPGRYYDHFLRALEQVLSEKGIVRPSDLEAALSQLQTNPNEQDRP